MAGGEGEGVRCPSTGRCRADDTVDGCRRDSFLGPYAGRWPSRGHERWRWNPRRALLVSPPLWGQTPSPQLCRQTDGQSACAGYLPAERGLENELLPGLSSAGEAK